jgi:hypothetical protein
LTSKLFYVTLEGMGQLNQHLSDKVSPPLFSSKQMCIVLLLVTILSGIGGYLIGVKAGKSTKSQLAVPPTQAAEQIPPTIIPTTTFSGYTVDYARDSQQVYLRYKGNVTISENSHYKTIPTNLVWHTVMQAPPSDDPNHEGIFSLHGANNPDYDFMFVMEWDAFHHDLYIHKKDSTLEKLATFDSTDKSNDGYNVPIINQISPNGMYVALDMYGCWYCGGAYPSVLLMNTANRKTRRIGQVSSFQWKTNGAYEYKDYQTQPCDINPQTHECPVDPQALPLKTGQF